MPTWGVIPALTTPFRGDAVAVEEIERNLERYGRLDLGGFLVLGSTGESVLLDEDERRVVLRTARAAIGADESMIAGVSAESTRRACEQSRVAAGCGADLVLVSTPHYYREQMSEDALVSHFEAIAESSPVPVLLYNVPKFTGLTIPPEAVRRASRHPNVAGIKESSGDLAYLNAVRDATPPDFAVLCGATGILRDAIDAGADGAVLAAATVMPEPLIRIVSEGRLPAEWLDGSAAASASVAGRPGIPGIKAAMDIRGLYGGPVRAPLRPVTPARRAAIEQTLDQMVDRGLISARQL